VKSYSESHVFMTEHLILLKKVQALVVSFPDTDNEGRLLRCHEVARAVAIAFDLTVIDGVYGCVQHSWCLIPRPQDSEVVRLPLKGDVGYLKSHAALGTHYPVIIDPYAVGRLPQAQMVSVGSTLPHDRWYSERNPRTDIREDALQLLCLVEFFPGKLPGERAGRWVGDSFLNKDGVKIV
jgi:hypothetical protein